MKKRLQNIMRHIAGATASHKSPFSKITTPSNKFPITQNFRDKWVIPFYRKRPSEDGYLDDFANLSTDLNSTVIDTLLCDFNWRTRSVGALFAAAGRYDYSVKTIGNHLLKSEVCFAGKSYCTALSCIATEEAIDFICQYLDYYLDRKDLYYDQAEAMASLQYLDPNQSESFEPKWNEFIADKPNWDLNGTFNWIKKDIEAINKQRENNTQ